MSLQKDEKRSERKATKVSVIGAGMVGSTLAYSLIVEGVAAQVVLVDANHERARGEAMDIGHAVPFSAPTQVRAGDYAECEDSDIVVITAGSAQKPGESRLSLVGRNVQILKSIVPNVVKVAPQAIIVIVSNPVDVLTYAAMRISGLPWQHVIGSGTILDTARFRYELSMRGNIDPRNVHAYIIGEHGDSEVPLWSQTRVAGMPFAKFCELSGRPCSQQELNEIFDRVRNAAYEIIRLKGATYYAVALATTRLIEAVLRDQRTILTASTLLNGQYDIRDVCLSVPIVVGRNGVMQIVEMPLTPEEQEALRRSGKLLREIIEQANI